jgi:hypothetical protein
MAARPEPERAGDMVPGLHFCQVGSGPRRGIARSQGRQARGGPVVRAQAVGLTSEWPFVSSPFVT